MNVYFQTQSLDRIAEENRSVSFGYGSQQDRGSALGNQDRAGDEDPPPMLYDEAMQRQRERLAAIRIEDRDPGGEFGSIDHDRHRSQGMPYSDTN